MMAFGHAATGVLFCGVVGPLLPSPLDPLSAGLIAMAAGAPLALVMDLDTKGKAYYALQPLSWVLKPLLVLLAKLIYHLTRGDDDPEETSGHRMLTHQPAFAGALALVALVWLWGSGWEWYVAGVVFVGVWSHRAGDACTKRGVPIGLFHVLVRSFRDEPKVWRFVGAPHKLRFVTGGKRIKKFWQAGKKRRYWDEVGEGVVTVVLAILGGILSALTVVGLYPGW
jgi:membrane-bound metal-dependent hydrolase YbcI (DUF457 family)